MVGAPRREQGSLDESAAFRKLKEQLDADENDEADVSSSSASRLAHSQQSQTHSSSAVADTFGIASADENYEWSDGWYTRFGAPDLQRLAVELGQQYKAELRLNIWRAWALPAQI